MHRLGLAVPAARVAVSCRGLLLADAAALRDVRDGLWAPARCPLHMVLRYALRPPPHGPD